MNFTRLIFLGILTAIALQRVQTMHSSKNNAKYLYSIGAEKKSDNLVALVRVMQIVWFVGMVAEVYILERSVNFYLFTIAILITIVSQIIRCLAAQELGYFCTHPIIVLENKSIVNTGIYSYIRHPAWLAMGLEFVFVPLIHSAYFTALFFAAINFFVTSKRVAIEEGILTNSTNYSIKMENTPRFIPRFPRSDKNKNQSEKTLIGEGDRVLVVGAGAAGLAVMNALKQASIPFDAVEKYSEIGGLWNIDRLDSPVSQNTHAIGHKSMQSFSGFPMPEDYPAYPSNRQILKYLIDFAQKKQLHEHIQFGVAVEKIERVDRLWRVSLSNQEVRTYGWVAIASGQHNDPHLPQFKGEFTGEIIHSSKYKKPQQLLDKKVLVVGAGQSAMDILEDSAITAQKTIHSTRSSFYIGSKFILGIPAERIANFPIVRNVPTQVIFKILAKISPLFLLLQGIDLSKLIISQNLPKSGFIKPVFNHNIYHYYLQGDLVNKPKIQKLKDNWVIFEDGSREKIDLIVCATGFKVSFPFIDKKYLNWSAKNKYPNLYLHCVNPDYDNLFVIGMIQPIGTHWQVFEAQSSLVAKYIIEKKKNICSRMLDRYKQRFQSSIRKKMTTETLVVDKRAYIKQIHKLIA